MYEAFKDIFLLRRFVYKCLLKVVLDDRYSPPVNTAGEEAKLLPRED